MTSIIDSDSKKGTEDHILAQANFISRVMETSPDVIHIVNITTGTTVYINKMLLSELGYSSEEIRTRQLEKTSDALYHPEDVPAVELFRTQIASASDEETIHMEARLKAHNGTWQWFRTRAKVFQRDEKNIPLKYIGFSQNITENKFLEEERNQNAILSELDRAKTEFFSNVSHEFRTPLALILGPLEDMLHNGEQNLSPLQIQKLQMIQRNGLRLQKLINTQLDFSRIEAGRMEAVFQPTQLARYTEDIASNFRSLIEAAGLTYVVKCRDPKEPIYVSRDMWEIIVLNLVSNAFKFTFEGRIEVILKVNKKHVQLHVHDTGIGISNDNLSRIFERFTRIEAVRSRAYEGTGIGLALVKELVAIHGGTIKVRSTPGKGTKFIVIIPKGKSHLPARQIYEFRNSSGDVSYAETFLQQAASWSAADARQKTSGILDIATKHALLIVDDNSDMRNYLETLLSENNQIILAENGMTAMELIQNGLSPDLIIADIMMPEMDGIEFLGRLKRDPKTARIPVMMISARSAEDSKISALRNGADDYIVKPFSAQAVKERIEVLIDLAKAR